jgi:hypothetical protein
VYILVYSLFCKMVTNHKRNDLISRIKKYIHEKEKEIDVSCVGFHRLCGPPTKKMHVSWAILN